MRGSPILDSMKTNWWQLTVGLTLGLTAGVTLKDSFAQGAAAPQGQKPLTMGDFPDLGKGLMATPGCVGIKVFSPDGGKQFVIMAWFENKRAVEAWYYGKMHTEAMAKFFPGISPKPPLSGFKDEKAPILMIASVTPTDKALPGQKLAVSQIAIEAYTPVPGGVALGSTFAPAGLKIPGLNRIDN